MPRRPRHFNVKVEIRTVAETELAPAQRMAGIQFWDSIFGVKKKEEAVSSSPLNGKE